MKAVKQRDYPVWVCYPCGSRHGFKKCGVATWHDDTCGVCGEVTTVTEPRDFGHLKNSWMKAYDRGVAITAYLDGVLAKEEMDRISPNKNTPTPVSEYRQLNDGELVMDGDEFWGMDKCWLPATEIGKKVTTYTHKMYRRPMTEISSQMTDTCPDCSNHPCDCGLPAGYKLDTRFAANFAPHIKVVEVSNIAEIIEQRDRLASGLKWIAGWNHQLFDENTAMQMRDKAEQALQSLNQPTP